MDERNKKKKKSNNNNRNKNRNKPSGNNPKEPQSATEGNVNKAAGQTGTRNNNRPPHRAANSNRPPNNPANNSTNEKPKE
jgi:hypothetical protein